MYIKNDDVTKPVTLKVTPSEAGNVDSNLSSGVIATEKLKTAYDTKYMTAKQVHNLEITEASISLYINYATESFEFSYDSGGSSTYILNSMFQVKYSTFDNEYGSFQQISDQMKNAKTDNVFQEILFPNEPTFFKCDIDRQDVSQSNNSSQ